jgi:hypothetical protein
MIVLRTHNGNNTIIEVHAAGLHTETAGDVFGTAAKFPL